MRCSAPSDGQDRKMRSKVYFEAHTADNSTPPPLLCLMPGFMQAGPPPMARWRHDEAGKVGEGAGNMAIANKPL